eukprot:1453795-Amphidinium_carterae.1
MQTKQCRVQDASSARASQNSKNTCMPHLQDSVRVFELGFVIRAWIARHLALMSGVNTCLRGRHVSLRDDSLYIPGLKPKTAGRGRASLLDGLMFGSV